MLNDRVVTTNSKRNINKPQNSTKKWRGNWSHVHVLSRCYVSYKFLVCYNPLIIFLVNWVIKAPKCYSQPSVIKRRATIVIGDIEFLNKRLHIFKYRALVQSSSTLYNKDTNTNFSGYTVIRLSGKLRQFVGT